MEGKEILDLLHCHYAFFTCRPTGPASSGTASLLSLIGQKSRGWEEGGGGGECRDRVSEGEGLGDKKRGWGDGG